MGGAWPPEEPPLKRTLPIALVASIAATVVQAQTPDVAERNRDAGRTITVQSTTSTRNSGLYDHILPMFEADTGIEARVVAVGTGQALKNAERCDGDVLLVHAREAEEAFVASGFGTERRDVMHNDFVIVGPPGDPAALADAATASDALAAIAGAEAPFASRGDDSGTHKKELALWEAAGIDPRPASGTWYRETGSGMGATLNITVEMDAYALTDRATWSQHGNRGRHAIAFEGDPALFNQYGVIPVSAEHCPSVDAEGASAFADWLTGERGQAAIAGFRPNGQRLFTPNAEG